MEFCQCGSLKVNGNCSNKKCVYHVKNDEMATFKQIEFIRELCERLDKDVEEYNFQDMTKAEAADIIQELREQADVDE